MADETKQTPDPLKNLSAGLNSLRDSLGRLVENAVSSLQSLPIDIVETETAIIVKAGPLVGVRPENLDVSITADSLTIKGETRPDDQGMEGSGSYLRRERKFGAFSRTVKIPRPIKVDQSQADFKGGMLTITLPKVENVQPKVISIRSVDPDS
jgi:HSP20 family protein